MDGEQYVYVYVRACVCACVRACVGVCLAFSEFSHRSAIPGWYFGIGMSSREPSPRYQTLSTRAQREIEREGPHAARCDRRVYSMKSGNGTTRRALRETKRGHWNEARWPKRSAWWNARIISIVLIRGTFSSANLLCFEAIFLNVF